MHDGAYPVPAPSLHGELHAKEIRVAVLETELRMERDARVRAERRAEQEGNRSLALAQQLGEFKQRVAMLEAPKEEPAAAPEPAPEPEPAPSHRRCKAACIVPAPSLRRQLDEAMTVQAAFHAHAPPSEAHAPGAGAGQGGCG